MKRSITGFTAAFLAIMILALCMPLTVLAGFVQNESQDTTVTSVATSPSESLPSIKFSTSNAKRIEVGRSTTLYVTKKNMKDPSTTVFSCSDSSIARVEKESDNHCRVHGLKTGEVVITATAGGVSDKYVLYVGDESATANSTTATGETAVTSLPPIDYLSENDERILDKYIIENKSSSAIDYLIGIIGWAAIIGLCALVLSVMFRNRSPKLNLYPGSRRRFNTGGMRGNQRKRLLPDHYYRNNKKY